MFRMRNRITLIILLTLISLLCLASCSKSDKTEDRSFNKTAGQGNLAKLQGRWQSQDDMAAQIEVSGDTLISYYQNEKMSTETVAFIKDAESRTPDPHGEYFIVMGEFDASIYSLVLVSEYHLEYSAAGRGNTLKYTRME